MRGRLRQRGDDAVDLQPFPVGGGKFQRFAGNGVAPDPPRRFDAAVAL